MIPIYKAGAIVIASLLVTNLITYRLWRAEVNEYAQFKSDVKAQSEALEAEAKRRAEASEQSSKDAALGWQNAVDYWKSRAGRIVTVRVPTYCNTEGLRPIPNPPEGIRPATTEPGFGTALDVAQCEERLNNAVLDAAQVEHIRAWINNQVKASSGKKTNN